MQSYWPVFKDFILNWNTLSGDVQLKENNTTKNNNSDPVHTILLEPWNR